MNPCRHSRRTSASRPSARMGAAAFWYCEMPSLRPGASRSSIKSEIRLSQAEATAVHSWERWWVASTSPDQIASGFSAAQPVTPAGQAAICEIAPSL